MIIQDSRFYIMIVYNLTTERKSFTGSLQQLKSEV